MKTKNRREGWL